MAESDPHEETQTVAPSAGGVAKEKAPRKAGFKDDAAIARECALFPVPPAGDCSNCRSNYAKGKCAMHRSVGNHKFANHDRKDWKDHIKDKGIADEPLRLGQVTKVDAAGKKKIEFYPTSFNSMVKYQVIMKIPGKQEFFNSLVDTQLSKPTLEDNTIVLCPPCIEHERIVVSNLCPLFFSVINSTQHCEERQAAGGAESIGKLEVIAALDCGANLRDFISESLAARLIAMGAQDVATCGRVCLARRGVCTDLHRSISGIACTYFNNLTMRWENFMSSPTVFPNAANDFVVGLQNVYYNDLLNKMITVPPQKMGNPVQKLPHMELNDVVMGLQDQSDCRSQSMARPNTIHSTDDHAVMSNGGHASPDSLQTIIDPEKEVQRGAVECPACFEYTHGENSTRLVRSSDFFGEDDESEGEPREFDQDSSIIPDLSGEVHTTPEVSDTDVIESIDIEKRGEPFDFKVREILEECRGVFSRTLRETPARISPMEIEVDADKLKKARLSGRARPLSEVKLAKLRVMLGALLRVKIIRACREANGSQVLLVAKKGSTKLRFCIDYRAINDATISPEGWPIPDIAELLKEIGTKGGKIFAVMDMTSGFHQAPLSEASKIWSTFVTPDGMYQWNRCPMGVKGGPSFFSKGIMSEVLVDLLHTVVLSYLDDLIVWGKDEEDFLINLRTVLKRLMDRQITLNPDKCRIGMSVAEFVGHTINGKTGELHFTRSKLDRVRDFPKPTEAGELKMFVGLANYYRAHVAHMSSLLHPLDEMLAGYEKRTRSRHLKWTHETTLAFERVRTMIDECPALKFVNPLWRVYVRTDASNYGIGAVMFQKFEDTGYDIPIEFLSKSLTKVQINWDTPEKEGYAIFYALKRWDHLLRDVNFVLETDHENLTFLKFDGSPKVKRWKMLIQEFRFDLLFIKGKDNGVADAMSRLCLNLEKKIAEAEKLAGGGLPVSQETFTEDGDLADGVPGVSHKPTACVGAAVVLEQPERLAAMTELWEQPHSAGRADSQDAFRPSDITSPYGVLNTMKKLHAQGFSFERYPRHEEENELTKTDKMSTLFVSQTGAEPISEMMATLFEIKDDFCIMDEETPIPHEIHDQITQAHNPMVGHGGVKRTVARLKRMGANFKRMRDWVDKFVRECPTCQKTDQRVFPVGTTPFTLATYMAMRRLGMDAIGPLIESEEGFKYIITIIDHFSRWVMCYPTISTDAIECVRAIIQQADWVSLGHPLQYPRMERAS